MDMTKEQLNEIRAAKSKEEAEVRFKQLKQYEVMLDRQMRLFQIEQSLRDTGLPNIGELNTIKYEFENIMHALQTSGAREKNATLMTDAKVMMSKMVAVKRLKEEDPELHYWRLFIAKMPPTVHNLIINVHDMPIDPMKLFDEVNPDGDLSIEQCQQKIIALLKTKRKETIELSKYIVRRSRDHKLLHGSPSMTFRDLRKEQRAARRLLEMQQDVHEQKLTTKEVNDRAARLDNFQRYQLALVERLENRVTERDIEMQKLHELENDYENFGRKGVKNVLTADMDETDMVPMSTESIILNKKLLKRNKAMVVDPNLHRKLTSDTLSPFSVNEILKKSLSKSQLKAQKEVSPQQQAMARATREQDRLLKHLSTAGFNNNRMFDANESTAVVDPAEVGEDADSAAPESVNFTDEGYVENEIQQFDDGTALVNQQRFVFARVVATFGHRVLVEQVGNQAYAKQSQFYVGDKLDHLLRAAGHEAYQLDSSDAFDEMNPAPLDDATIVEPVPSAVASALSSMSPIGAATPPEEARARSLALGERKRWQCLKSRHMALLCGDYVFIDPHPARPWNQSSVTSSSALPVIGHGNGDGVVRAVFKRHNELQRGSRNSTTRNIAEDALAMCANADHMVVICAAEGQPVFSPFLIDRYISAAVVSNMKITVVYNKIDLIADVETVETEEKAAAEEPKEFKKKLSKKEQKDLRRQLAKESRKAERNQDLEYLAQLKAEGEEQELARKDRKKIRRARSKNYEINAAGATTRAADAEVNEASDHGEDDWNDETFNDEERLMRWIKRKSRYSRADADQVLHDYERLGFRVIRTSTRTGEGLEDLRSVLARHHTTVFVGPSGVGKSSLLNAMIPDIEIRTRALTLSGHGTHTTTNAALYHMQSGGQIIDTPGSQSFMPPPVVPDAVSLMFPEIEAARAYCKLSNKCTHTNEPGCAVKELLRDGTDAMLPITIFELFDDGLIDDPRIVEFRRRLRDGELRPLAKKPGYDPLLQYVSWWYRDFDAGHIKEDDEHYRPIEMWDQEKLENHPFEMRDEAIRLEHLRREEEEKRQKIRDAGFEVFDDDDGVREADYEDNVEEEPEFDGDLNFSYDLTAMKDALLSETTISEEFMQQEDQLQKLIDNDAMLTAQAMAALDLEDKVTTLSKRREEEDAMRRAKSLGVSLEKYRTLQARVRQMDNKTTASSIVSPQDNAALLSIALMEERKQGQLRRQAHDRARFKSYLPEGAENQYLIPKSRYRSYVQMVQVMRDTAKARERVKRKSLTVLEEEKLEKDRKRFELREKKSVKKLAERTQESREKLSARAEADRMLQDLKEHEQQRVQDMDRESTLDDLVNVGASHTPHKKPESTKGKFIGSYYGPQSILKSSKDRNPDGTPRVHDLHERLADMRGRAEEMYRETLKHESDYTHLVRQGKKIHLKEELESSEADPFDARYLGDRGERRY
jgi:ribosome small subunit-dependent GTPase A